MGDEPERSAGTVFPRRDGEPAATLARRVARLGAVFDAMPIGAGVWTATGELVHPNPVLCDLLGAPRDELIGRRFEEFIDPAAIVGIRSLVDEVWRGERNAFECDLRCRTPGGAAVWLRTHVTAGYGPGAVPEYVVTQVFSFVARRAAEDPDRLAWTESPAMLWLTDELGIPRTGNLATFEFFGLPPGVEELSGDTFETMHPDDYGEVRDMLAEHIGARRPYEFIARSMRHDGQWRWLHHRARPVSGADGLFTGWAGASIDVTALERERRRLDEIRHLFETVTEDGPLAVVRTDSVGRVTYANGRLADLLDDPASSLRGLSWRGVLRRHAEEVVERATTAADDGRPFAMRVEVDESVIAPHRRGLDGGYWAELRVAPVYADDGVHDGFVATIADISAEVAADARARQLARVLDAGSDFLLIAERNGGIVYGNRAAEDVLGAGPVERRGDRLFLFEVLTDDSFELFHEVVEPVLLESGRWRGELSLRDRRGREIPVSALILADQEPSGRIESISVVARDITDLKDAQARMRQLATHDYLTGLPNRVLLYERLDQALARHARLGQTVALLYLDLDGFKPVNDQLGHHIGDAVLVELADRIDAVVRDTDTAARIGGDEFAVLIEGHDADDLVETVARRLVDTIARPVAVDGREVGVGVSIGIVTASAGVDADTLLARADAAMYAAKAAGRGRFVRVDDPA